MALSRRLLEPPQGAVIGLRDSSPPINVMLPKMKLSPRMPSLGVLLECPDVAQSRGVAKQASVALWFEDTVLIITTYADVLTTTGMYDALVATIPTRKDHRARCTSQRIIVGVDDALKRVATRRSRLSGPHRYLRLVMNKM